MKSGVFLTVALAGLYGPLAHAAEPASGEIISRPLIDYRQAPPAPRLPESVVPRRYYQAPAPALQYPAPQPPIVYEPPPAPPSQPAVMDAPREQRMVPAEQYDHLRPAPQSYVAPPVAAPTVMAQHSSAPPPLPAENLPAPGRNYESLPTSVPVPASARADDAFYATELPRDRYSFTIEGYYDLYEEDSVALEDRGYFGSLAGSYTHYFDEALYTQIDLRGSYGRTWYESISGTIDNIPQWEVEGRLLAGYDIALGGGTLRPYTGLGSRYFEDELKGKVSSLGFLGYERRIFQLYLPIGLSYDFNAYGLQFTPNIEYDHLLYGYVNSRLGTIPGLYNLENTQDEGQGLRGEFLVGQIDTRGTGWQAGPFFRYWDVADSDIVTNPAGSWLEPENTRLQVGAALKMRF